MKKTHGIEAEKETCAEEKRASLGEALEKGILIFLVCAVLSNPNRVTGTSSLWSSGRLTPNGGARNGNKIFKNFTYAVKKRISQSCYTPRDSFYMTIMYFG